MQIRVFCTREERLRGGGGHKGACTDTHTCTLGGQWAMYFGGVVESMNCTDKAVVGWEDETEKR